MAVGTASGHVLGGSLILLMLVRGRSGMRVTWGGLRPDRDLIRRLLRIGVPGGIDVGAVVMCHMVVRVDHQFAGNIWPRPHTDWDCRLKRMSYLPGAAFQVAAATLAGQYLGSGDGPRASRGVLLTCLVGCTVMSCAAFAFFFAGQWLTAFFTGEPARSRRESGRQLAARSLRYPLRRWP